MAEDNVQVWDGIDQEEEFEFDEVGVIENVDTTESDEDEDVLPVEFGIDFTTGKMTGGKVTGLEAVKVWAWNALKTPRYMYEQNTWNYGSELEDLIGRLSMPIEYIESEAKRMCRECLMQNKYIEGIKNFECMVMKDVLVCSFTMITAFGEVEQNVAIR